MQVTEALSVYRETESIYFFEIYTQGIYPKRHQDSVRFVSVALCAIDTSVHCV